MILIPILGDQRSHALASLSDVPKEEAVVLMMEVSEETGYVKHHEAKIAIILSVMRHFAAELEADGWTVDYVKLDQRGNSGTFTGGSERAIRRHKPGHIRIVEAGEWRVQKAIEGSRMALGLPVDILPDDRFLYRSSIFRPGPKAGTSW